MVDASRSTPHFIEGVKAVALAATTLGGLYYSVDKGYPNPFACAVAGLSIGAFSHLNLSFDRREAAPLKQRTLIPNPNPDLTRPLSEIASATLPPSPTGEIPPASPRNVPPPATTEDAEGDPDLTLPLSEVDSAALPPSPTGETPPASPRDVPPSVATKDAESTPLTTPNPDLSLPLDKITNSADASPSPRKTPPGSKRNPPTPRTEPLVEIQNWDGQTIYENQKDETPDESWPVGMIDLQYSVKVGNEMGKILSILPNPVTPANLLNRVTPSEVKHFQNKLKKYLPSIDDSRVLKTFRDALAAVQENYKLRENPDWKFSKEKKVESSSRTSCCGPYVFSAAITPSAHTFYNIPPSDAPYILGVIFNNEHGSAKCNFLQKKLFKFFNHWNTDDVDHAKIRKTVVEKLGEIYRGNIIALRRRFRNCELHLPSCLFAFIKNNDLWVVSVGSCQATLCLPNGEPLNLSARSKPCYASKEKVTLEVQVNCLDLTKVPAGSNLILGNSPFWDTCSTEQACQTLARAKNKMPEGFSRAEWLLNFAEQSMHKLNSKIVLVMELKKE